MDILNHMDEKMTYDVRTIKPKHLPQMDVVKQFKKQTYAQITRKARYRNDKHDVYFRPEKLQYILVDMDDVKAGMINKAKALNALFIVRTSNKCFQAWFYCPQVKTKDDYVKVARYLAKELGGDMGATQSYQIGRLPGYHNKKQGRNNFYAYVVYSISSARAPFELKFNFREWKAMDKIGLTKPEVKPKKQEKSKVVGTYSRPSVESNPMPMFKKYDWYLLSERYRQNPNTHRIDYVRLLTNEYIDDIPKDYILNTVDNFMKKIKI
jgi:CRISPR/Cas system CMR-associated protein Cmr1 (group 7 of RAMP superfamily)